MERIERLMLSPQHSLHLVRVAGRALLVGVSPAGIQVLERIAESGTTAEASGGDGR
jgi:flagellar biogenesis protein FliO